MRTLSSTSNGEGDIAVELKGGWRESNSGTETDLMDGASLSREQQQELHKRTKKLMIVAGCLLGAVILSAIFFVLLVTGTIPTRKRQIVGPKSRISSTVTLTSEYYGRLKDGRQVNKFIFKNGNNVELHVINYGGIITAIKVPDLTGKIEDVVLGFDDIKGYEREDNPYFGALVGRFANRIRYGTFTIDGIAYRLNLNNGQHHLHGGIHGWDEKLWDYTQYTDRVVLSYVSPDGDEGYPGDVKVNATYQLTDDNEVLLSFEAKAVGKATPINLIGHTYFNLAKEGADDIYDHEATIFAQKYTVADSELLPTGEIASVQDTAFDLRKPTLLRDAIFNNTAGGPPGLDHNFVIQGPTGKRLAGRVRHPRSGRILEVYTNQPGMHFYTGNFLPIDKVKNNKRYNQHSGFCMETQNFPDAINKPNFPDCILRPDGSVYHHQIWYKFYTQ